PSARSGGAKGDPPGAITCTSWPAATSASADDRTKCPEGSSAPRGNEVVRTAMRTEVRKMPKSRHPYGSGISVRREGFGAVLLGSGPVSSHHVHLRPLAAATGGLGGLLPALHRRLHVVAATLELAQDTLGGHLPLQVLDGALDSLVAHGDLERLALNRVGRHR